MRSLGLSFDPSTPLVATSAFMAGVDKIEAGDAFDWRARGMTELEALTLFSVGMLTAAPASSATPNQAKPVHRQQRR